MTEQARCRKQGRGRDDGVALITAVAVVFMFAALVVAS